MSPIMAFILMVSGLVALAIVGLLCPFEFVGRVTTLMILWGIATLIAFLLFYTGYLNDLEEFITVGIVAAGLN